LLGCLNSYFIPGSDEPLIITGGEGPRKEREVGRGERREGRGERKEGRKEDVPRISLLTIQFIFELSDISYQFIYKHLLRSYPHVTGHL